MKSTIGQLRDFKESFIWQDMCEELDVWLEQVREQLEDPDSVFDDRQIHKLQGNAETIRNTKNIVDILIGLAEEELDRR